MNEVVPKKDMSENAAAVAEEEEEEDNHDNHNDADADEELAELRRLDTCLDRDAHAYDWEELLRHTTPRMLNRMIPNANRFYDRVGHTLLYTAVWNGVCDVVALLLLHGADPFQTALWNRGEGETTNAVELCEVHLHAQPTRGMFLLRLLDTRPVETAGAERWLVNKLGRDVDAPLAHPTLTRAGDVANRMNALEWACREGWVHCVRWLVYVRKADPMAAKGGVDGLLRLVNERLDFTEQPRKRQNLLQIQALLTEWWQRRAAVAMAHHGRLGAASPLRVVGPDALSLIMRQI